MSDFKLLPCPFCGRTPTYKVDRVSYDGEWREYYHNIICKCGIKLESYTNKKYLINKWNTRKETR